MFIYRHSLKEIHALGKLISSIRRLSNLNFNSISRYIINFLLDSTIGLFIIYIGIRICIYVAKVKSWEAINFGEYSEFNVEIFD